MLRQTADAKLIMELNPMSHISEAYRTLKTNIQFSKWDETLRTIVVTSTLAGEGKTTTICNLAISYAKEGKKVLLIDGDMRKPTIHRIFSINNRIGLSNVLANQYTVSEVIRSSSIDNLNILPSGPIPPNPVELLSSPNLTVMLKDIRESYDMILIDTPPILSVADGLIISSLSDGVVLVVQAGKVKRQLIIKSKEKLEYVKAPILGAVLNNKKSKKIETQYYEYNSNLE